MSEPTKESYRKSLYNFGLSEFIRNNPGKTEKDYKNYMNLTTRQTQEKMARKKVDNSMDILLFIYTTFVLFGVPALIAWIITLVAAVNFCPIFFALLFILPLIRIGVRSL